MKIKDLLGNEVFIKSLSHKEVFTFDGNKNVLKIKITGSNKKGIETNNKEEISKWLGQYLSNKVNFDFLEDFFTDEMPSKKEGVYSVKYTLIFD